MFVAIYLVRHVKRLVSQPTSVPQPSGVPSNRAYLHTVVLPLTMYYMSISIGVRETLELVRLRPYVNKFLRRVEARMNLQRNHYDPSYC